MSKDDLFAIEFVAPNGQVAGLYMAIYGYEGTLDEPGEARTSDELESLAYDREDLLPKSSESATSDANAFHRTRGNGRVEDVTHKPPPWAIGFSKQFRKDTSSLDRNLMGRILEVLTDVSWLAPPFKPVGDTFKCLTGELAGCWRYRVGDYRLVLCPRPELSQIDVLAFGARGSVYD